MATSIASEPETNTADKTLRAVLMEISSAGFESLRKENHIKAPASKCLIGRICKFVKSYFVYFRP
jgi:hypothetical protein